MAAYRLIDWKTAIGKIFNVIRRIGVYYWNLEVVDLDKYKRVILWSDFSEANYGFSLEQGIVAWLVLALRVEELSWTNL